MSSSVKSANSFDTRFLCNYFLFRSTILQYLTYDRFEVVEMLQIDHFVIFKKITPMLLMGCLVIISISMPVAHGNGLGDIEALGQDEPDDEPKKKKSQSKRRRPFGAPVDEDKVESIDPSGIVSAKVQGNGTRIVVWKVENTWHIRTHAYGSPRVFEGIVKVTGGKILNLEGLGALEKPDYTKKGVLKNAKTADFLSMNNNRSQLQFEFHTNTKGYEELDFEVAPTTTHVHFKLHIDRAPDLEKTFIGSSGAHPVEKEFILKNTP